MSPVHETALRPAKQRRSQQSLEKILTALLTLIEEKTFAEITVTEICERAGVAVGTFYERVGCKDNLLAHLRARCFDEITDATASMFTRERWRGACFESMLVDTAHDLVQLHRRHRGSLRVILGEGRRHAEVAAHVEQLNRALMYAVCDAWARHRVHDDEPEPLVRHAFIMASGYLREVVVWDDQWPARADDHDPPLDEAAVIDALARMLISSLMPARGRGYAPRGP